MGLVEYKKTVEYPLRVATLCFLVREGEVLLAMKKRGFGEGKWNGSGGKVNNGETIEEAAIREVEEEIGVRVRNMRKMAELDFYFVNNRDWCQMVMVFVVDEWEGEPIESEEMRPEWFSVDSLPFEEMWTDDKYWLPRVLKGEEVEAEFLFGVNEIIEEMNI